MPFYFPLGYFKYLFALQIYYSSFKKKKLPNDVSISVKNFQEQNQIKLIEIVLTFASKFFCFAYISEHLYLTF